MPIHIIAEACTNHDGSEEKARELILKARDVGADSVKFQIIYPEELYVGEILTQEGWKPNPVIEQRRKCQLSDDVYRNLAEFGRGAGIAVSASIFDTHGLRLLESMDVPYIKIASCDLNNLPFLAQVASYKKMLVLSSGMAELTEIDQALETVAKHGSPKIVLMHCVSQYPTPLEYANLSMIPLLKEKFGVEIGFSDHTLGSAAATVALALGATWFEKHFTLNKSDEGFDHAHSTPPHEFAEYVNILREVEKACKLQKCKVTDAERDLSRRARRGMYAKRDLQVGEILEDDDILIVRPETVLKPEALYTVIGKKIRKSLRKFEPIEKGL